MQTRKVLTIWFLALALVLCRGKVSEAADMGTAFTYQGRLIDAGEAADGLYDFQFKLYDANTDGNQLSSDVNMPEADVIDGAFMLELDFGNVYDGNERWLEIGVRPGDMNDPNVYTFLEPLQEVTPTPYALHTRWFLVDEALDNIFAGEDAGASNTIGWQNSAMGTHALYSNTEGVANSAMGYLALNRNTTGNLNSAMGFKALNSNTIGASNSAMGCEALKSNTTGASNSAMGYSALYSNTTAAYNSAMGYQALYSNTTGFSNSAMGLQALYSNTTGSDNSAMGYRALRSNTTANANTAMGNNALFSNTTGSANSAIGFEALKSNTTGAYNSAVGNYALFSNTTGRWNSAMGHSALWSNTTGFANSAMGFEALKSNTTANANTAMGYNALYSNTTANANTAMGYNALFSNTTGYGNSAMGYYALAANTTGCYNSAVGNYADYYNQGGSRNTIIGYAAGRGMGVHTKSGNVFLGYHAGYYETGSDKLYIGNSDVNTIIYGDFSTGRVGVGTTSPQNRLDVEGALAVGATYSGTDTAPTNGMIVEGHVGIGTTSPAATLTINDNITNIYPGVPGLMIGNNGNSAIWVGKDSDNYGAFEWIDPYLRIWSQQEVRFALGGQQDRIVFDSSGNVGIGVTDPTEDLDVAGTARLRGIAAQVGANYVHVDGNGKLWKTSSSRRYKTNIKDLETDKDAVLELRPVTYQCRSTGKDGIGLIAEEVAEHLPDLVIYDEAGRPDAVKYDRVSLYLLDVARELKAENDSLKQRLEDLERVVEQLAKAKEIGL